MKSFPNDMDIARKTSEWQSGKPGPPEADCQEDDAGNDHKSLHDVIHLHSIHETH